MKLPYLLAEIHRRDRLLSWTGWAHAFLAGAFLAGVAFDGRLILGINPWIKPLKFAVSIAIYVWTVAWLLGELRRRVPRSASLISRGVCVSLSVEIVCIAGQAFRGVPSHFNHGTPLNDAVFGLMGSMILLNTLLAILLLALFMRVATNLAPPLLWGIRLGLVGFLLGSAVGGGMVAHDAHTVGERDGGPGLPAVNWSTVAGDLRPSHGLGLHALQVLPFFGWAVGRRPRLAEARKTALVLGFSAAYLLIMALVLAQALQGRPLIPLH